jgi:translation initiation factor 5B
LTRCVQLRILGIERAKREEIARAREKEAEALRCEMEREEAEAELKKQESRQRRKKRDEAAYAARSMDNLRSPISVIMGHVDTGKTKLLDKIRNTNVQEGEAGGITQQIGATQFPQHTLQEKVEGVDIKVEIPGLLMIDTPGHESFTNLRNRGSTLCDIAILVIDLMHGLEQQTIESLNMLRNKKAPFVIALNKVDRCYGWKSEENSPIRKSLARQDANTLAEFKDRKEQVMLQLSQQGINTALYWDNDSPEDTISLVPTSAMTGEGVPDILGQLITYSQTTIREKLQYVESMQCTVLEVKVIEGLGTTVDVVLVNGTLKEGDTIIVSTMEGPVVTQVRALLTPPPNREMRIKADYQHHSSINGSIGVKIVAPDIGRAVAGTPIMVVHDGDEVSDVMEDVQSDLAGLMKGLSTDAKGVMVHASTLGALEALLQFLREECKPPIPVSHISIGTIFKKDVMRAGLMHDKNLPEFATILAFDVSVDKAASEMAEDLKVKIFTADIIYHLFDQFSAYMEGITNERKAKAEELAVFPCICKIMPQFIFNKKDPVVVGVEVLEGVLKVGTPLVVPATGMTDIGRVIGIENNRKEVQSAKKGASVSVKISNEANPSQQFGRQVHHYSTTPTMHRHSRASHTRTATYLPHAYSNPA